MTFALIATATAAANTPSPVGWPPVSTTQYDSRRYKLTVGEYKHGEVTIRIAQLKRIGDFGDGPPYACRAWLQVLKGQQVAWQVHFADIDAVGSSYGLFVPKVQPRPFLAVVKNGDYAGRLYLIGKDGSVLESIGGLYILTSDGRYLISELLSDVSGIAVLDLAKPKVLFSVRETPYIQQWYQSGSTYFFTESEWLPSNKGQPTEKLDKVYLVDVEKRRLRAQRSNLTTIQRARKVALTFDPRDYVDCAAPSNIAFLGSLSSGVAAASAP
jgi:hypothetical protein